MPYIGCELEMVQTKWMKYRNDVLGTPKFLRKGTKVIVETDAPEECEIKGQYGKRKMFIIRTKNYGLIYVSQLQLVAIADAFHEDYSSAITVEL